jgi:hypothetical protein
VEIHTGGDVGTATYKWSKDNASTVSQIIENVKGNPTSVKVKDVKLFKIGDVIEITDDRVELADRKYISEKSSIKPWGELRRITSIDRDKNELAWAAASEASGDPLPMTGGLSSEEKLEDGIKIRFSGSDMLPGDYWTFTARENTRAVEKLDNEPPQGVVHRYYPLAVIKWDKNGEIKNITDLRTRFEPLCGLTAADLAFDNANTPIWKGARNVQQALERVTFPNAEGIEFTNKCGDLYGNDTDNVQAALDYLCNGITVPSLALKCNDIAQSRWPKLKCSDSGDISFLAGAESLVERMRISADGNVGIGTIPKEKLDVSGNLRINGDFKFPNTGEGFAALTNQHFDNEKEFQNNNIKFKLGSAGPIGRERPHTLSYEFIVGHARTFLGLYPNPPRTEFIKQFSINQNGDLYCAGSKTGYVVDYFVNRIDGTLEQGDVVVISEYQVSHYSGDKNNIPIPKVDLTDRAYDTRVCGIVSKVVTEKDLPYVEVEPEAQAEPKNSKEKKTEIVVPYKHPLQEFAAKFSEKLDYTKVQDKQMGKMVTLGAFAHCKVDADIAPIEVGDLLTTSPTKGHAQKVLEPEKAVGAIIGKALGSLKKGKGKIPVLVMLQ